MRKDLQSPIEKNQDIFCKFSKIGLYYTLYITELKYLYIMLISLMITLEKVLHGPFQRTKFSISRINVTIILCTLCAQYGALIQCIIILYKKST